MDDDLCMQSTCARDFKLSLLTSLQSVSQTLHTTAASLIGSLIDCHLTSDNVELSYTLLRRVLTALIHHCNSLEQFSVVASLVIDRFCALSQAEDLDNQKLQRAMHITSVVCAVRQGSRLSCMSLSFLCIAPTIEHCALASHLTQLSSRLASLPLDAYLHSELLIFTSSLLTAGDMTMSVGPGRAFVTRVLSVPSFGLMLCGILAELGWGGWKLVGLPSLLTATRTLLQSEPSLTLRLLAYLHTAGKLGEVDVVWKRSVGGWIQNRLSCWQISDESTDDLHNMLSLSLFVDSLPSLLVPIIERSLETSNPDADWQTSYANAAWVIGTCMHALSRCPSTSWQTHVDLTAWTTKIVDRWSWSGVVLKGLVALIESWYFRHRILPHSY